MKPLRKIISVVKLMNKRPCPDSNLSSGMGVFSCLGGSLFLREPEGDVSNLLRS